MIINIKKNYLLRIVFVFGYYDKYFKIIKLNVTKLAWFHRRVFTRSDMFVPWGQTSSVVHGGVNYG